MGGHKPVGHASNTPPASQSVNHIDVESDFVSNCDNLASSSTPDYTRRVGDKRLVRARRLVRVCFRVTYLLYDTRIDTIEVLICAQSAHTLFITHGDRARDISNICSYVVRLLVSQCDWERRS